MNVDKDYWKVILIVFIACASALYLQPLYYTPQLSAPKCVEWSPDGTGVCWCWSDQKCSHYILYRNQSG